MNEERERKKKERGRRGGEREERKREEKERGRRGGRERESTSEWRLYLLIIRQAGAHAKLAGAGLHALANHEAVAWLKDVEWTQHGGEAEGADKDRDLMLVVLPHLGQLIQLLFVDLQTLLVLLLEVGQDDGLQRICHRRPSLCQVLKHEATAAQYFLRAVQVIHNVKHIL